MISTKYKFDPEKLIAAEIIVDKLEIASRQLETAIVMFFNDWDVVSQHTLISAAHGVVHDLAKEKRIKGSIKDSPLIRPDRKKEFIDAVNLPQNYFKHANKDGRVKLAFRYNVSHFYLFDAVRLYILLSGCLTEKMKIFVMWFQLRYPDLLCHEPAEEYLIKIRETTSDPEAFKILARKMIEDIR